MHKALRPKDDTERLYVSRKEGGRGFVSIEHRVGNSKRHLDDYIKKNKEGLITANKNNTNNTSMNRTTITRKQKWKEKQLYGYFKRQTSEISYEKIRIWLRTRKLKRKTESFLIEAQNNTIRTNYVKAKIDMT